MSKPSDIHEVMRDAQSSASPAAREGRKIHKKRLEEARKLLRATENEAMSALRAAGLTGDALKKAMQVWRDGQS